MFTGGKDDNRWGIGLEVGNMITGGKYDYMWER